MCTPRRAGTCLIALTLLLAACSRPARRDSPTATPVPSAVQSAEPGQVTQPAGTGTEAPSVPSSIVPLKDALANLEPQDVSQNFYDITQIPRPSGHMDEIRDFLVKFGRGLELETIVDEAGNVLIRRPRDWCSYGHWHPAGAL